VQERAQAEGRLVNLEGELDALRDELEEAEVAVGQLDEARETIAGLEAKPAEHNDVLGGDPMQRFADMERKLKAAQSDGRSVRVELEDALTKVRDLEGQLANATRASDEDLQHNLDAANERITELKSRLKDIRRERKKLLAQLDGKRPEPDNDKVTELEAEVERLTKALRAAEAKPAAAAPAGDDAEELREELVDAQEEIQRLTTDIDKYKDRLRKQRRKNRKLLEAAGGQMPDADEDDDELAAAQARIRDLEAQLKSNSGRSARVTAAAPTPSKAEDDLSALVGAALESADKSTDQAIIDEGWGLDDLDDDLSGLMDPDN